MKKGRNCTENIDECAEQPCQVKSNNLAKNVHIFLEWCNLF